MEVRRHRTWKFDPPGSTEWFARAACRHQTDIMFPKRHIEVGGMLLRTPDEEYQELLDVAKKVCDVCVVRPLCREYGLALAQQVETHGVFGGLDEDERAEILGYRSQYQPKPIPMAGCGTPAGERRHRRLKEPTCDLCRQDANRRKREIRNRNKREAKTKGVDG